MKSQRWALRNVFWRFVVVHNFPRKSDVQLELQNSGSVQHRRDTEQSHPERPRPGVLIAASAPPLLHMLSL